ncbi:MAG: FGGY family carbohydrate kinase [Actinomycetota bacterium]
MYLGIDIGTSSSKGALISADGETLRSMSIPHGIDIPRPGWAEQDADRVWWTDVVQLCRGLLDGSPYSGADIDAVAISAIGPCVLPLDASGRPLRPGILYGVDGRAAEQIASMEAELGRDEIQRFAGMDLSSQATGPKIMWIRDHEPDVWNDAAIFTTASSYVVFRLTGEHVIDHHTAAHTIPLYDRATNTWSDRFAETVVSPDRLPRLGWSDEVAGTVTGLAAAETGLAPGTPVAVGAVDALSEAVGVGAVETGDLMLMYGSTAFFILAADEPEPSPGMWLLPGAFEGSQTIAAGMSTTGLITDWFRSLVSLDELVDFDRLFAEAAAVPAGSGGLIVLPYFFGERTPINDPDARGVVLGLSLAHSRGHFFRAVLEGIAYGIRHNLEAMAAAGSPIRRIAAVGGGTSGGLLTGVVSSVTGRSQQVPPQGHGAVRGNAFLAGLAHGSLDRRDLSTWTGVDHTVDPGPDHEVYESGYRRYLATYRATADLVHAGVSAGNSL